MSALYWSSNYAAPRISQGTPKIPICSCSTPKTSTNFFKDPDLPYATPAY